MGVSVACPLADFVDKMDSPAVFVRSINVRTALRSISFNGRDSEPTMIRFFSGKMILKQSLSFKGRELETKISLVKSPNSSDNKENNKVQVKSVSLRNGDTGSPLPAPDNASGNLPSPLSSEPGNQRNLAALRLQKVYKSFRTRRQLADCAVLVEQRWWKVLDFAELKRSSISFFEIEKPETAVSRWSRARTRAAKVGKGLSKDEKARKLALQHWLEAIDPRHRYGHNLQFYYVTWLHCNSKQPFFYWLDIGDGREVNLERCPRSKLQHQCIKYLGPTERLPYEVIVESGKLVYKQSGKFIDTTGESKEVKWIFVLSTSKTLYVGQKNKGKFQHSSFLAGGATLSAGRLEAENGTLKSIWPHSGHYLPTEENFLEFMAFLHERNVDLTDVKQSPSEEGEFSGFAKNESSQADENLAEEKGIGNAREAISRLSRGLHSKITKLEIPNRDDVIDDLKREAVPPEPSFCTPRPLFASPYYSSDDDGYETAEDSPFSEDDFTFQKPNLFGEDEEEHKKPIPKEKIVQRIDSHKGMKSYQLAQQLTSKWTTGAGPRIGCMKDYPSELRFLVLEQAHLSPRPTGIHPSPRIMSRFGPLKA